MAQTLFLCAAALLAELPCLLGWHGAGVGTFSEAVLVPLHRAAGEKRLKKVGGWEREKRRLLAGQRSLWNRLIQFAFGSGWERGCWSSLELAGKAYL